MEQDMQEMFNSMFDFTGESAPPAQNQPQANFTAIPPSQPAHAVQAQFVPQNKVQQNAQPMQAAEVVKEKEENAIMPVAEQITPIVQTAPVLPAPQVQSQPEQVVQNNIAKAKKSSMPTEQDERQAFKYSIKEWDAKEMDYTNKVNATTLPPDVKPADIQRCALQIDALLTELRIDGAYVRQKYEVYETQKKYEESVRFQRIKHRAENSKSSVDVINGLVKEELSYEKWNGTQYDIYHLINVFKSRLIFVEEYINLLRDKKDFLITHSGMLKIENTVNNFIPNVPQNIPQNNQQYTPQQPVQQPMNGGVYYGQQ